MGTPQEHPNKWRIAFKYRGGDIFDLTGLTVLNPPPGHYIADPFIYKDYLFYELYNYKKGIIVCAKLNGLEVGEPQVVLDLPYHVSFPSIFEDNGKLYMTPEEGKAGVLQVYECIAFPTKWRVVSEVARGTFGDSVVYKDGTYKIYTTESDHHPRVYQAGSLYGPWNRISAYEKINSRLAGHLFTYDNQLLKPVQDCVGEYGKKVILKRMDGSIYKTLEPWGDLSGFHTFNFNDTYVVVDGRD